MAKDNKYRPTTLYEQIGSELEDFKSSKPLLAFGDADVENSGWHYSQRETINTIDLAYDAKFKYGKYDAEGNRKVYMNEIKFRCEVAVKQIDIDVSNYLFIPDGTNQIYKTAFMSWHFKRYVRENYHSEVIDELTEDFVKYGTCVSKQVGDVVKRVPLKSLRNTQTAYSLQEAAESGGYVIEEHELSWYQAQDYPDWDVDKVTPYEGKRRYFERYGLVSEADYKLYKNEEPVEGDWTNFNLCVVVAYLENPDAKSDHRGKVIYVEKVHDWPYEEAHYNKRDGRWLGVGPAEDLLENQIMVNLSANLRVKGLSWHVKRVFQSKDEAVRKNLARQVVDGQVLYVGQNGEISEVPLAGRGTAEFTSAENFAQQNADQKAFTYEVMTGESLPSNTPFRLGVLQSNAALKYYEKKREKLGLYLKRSYFEQLVPIFKREVKDETIILEWGATGIDLLRQAYFNIKVNQRLADAYFKVKPISRAEAELDVIEQLEREPFMKWDVKKGVYDNTSSSMELVITGEAMDVDGDIESYTNLWQTLKQEGDPRAEQVLDMIFALRGKHLPSLYGTKRPTTAQTQLPQLPKQQPVTV